MNDPQVNLAYYLRKEHAESRIPNPLPEGVVKASPELEPDKGWVIVFHTEEEPRRKYADGVEHRKLNRPEVTDSRKVPTRRSATGDEEEKKRRRRERRAARRAAKKRSIGG